MSQVHADTIVFLNGNRQICEIQKVDKESIQYSFWKKEILKNNSALLNDLSYFVYRGEKRIIAKEHLDIPLNSGGVVVKSLPEEELSKDFPLIITPEKLHNASLAAMIIGSTFGLLFLRSNEFATAGGFLVGGLILGSGFKVLALHREKTKRDEQIIEPEP